MNTKKTENVFRNRNYRLVFFGALVSEIGALLYWCRRSARCFTALPSVSIS